MNTNLNAFFESLSSAYKERNLDTIFDLHHPDNVLFNAGKEQLRTVLSSYTLEANFEDIKILQEDKNVSVVRLSQKTKKVEGPDFKDNIIDMVMILKSHNDNFKILSSASISTDFI
ncbi:hypothetical protein IWQ47_003802 [Aquimarina sp. EL_43]|uniref:hypothetical protein n=1 Tax=Aquimarina TaxID=290174 RepID=UPI00046F7D48|nr:MULTISPECIES: hypothetical protein [Aquimarina]MBG6132577.1 hypothetical protein [Aquimarina sp. EL_35]MBG6152708.1 hypothetical protein [Aquimarina sp. EL_32]MBG6170715.1 hypothetical protein [Aquimarina sp. EL_43]